MIHSRLTSSKQLPTIRIDFDRNHFTVTDDCGGIDYKSAKRDVFTFGHRPGSGQSGQLGVYGIGLKRAYFQNCEST